MSHFVVFPVIAPLQSWGVNGVGLHRPTHSHPTKSGIVGVICSALGIHRGDPRLLEVASQAKVNVRVDKAGKNRKDFQIFTFKKEPDRVASWGSSADKDHPDKSWLGSKMRDKFYLNDAAFVVAVEAPSLEVAQQWRDALISPQNLLYWGRKSCPTGRIHAQVVEAESPRQALDSEFFAAGACDVVYLLEDINGGFVLRDDPAGFNELGLLKYRERFLRREVTKVSPDGRADERDAFADEFGKMLNHYMT